jgi:hypothetical protein
MEAVEEASKELGKELLVLKKAAETGGHREDSSLLRHDTFAAWNAICSQRCWQCVFRWCCVLGAKKLAEIVKRVPYAAEKYCKGFLDALNSDTEEKDRTAEDWRKIVAKMKAKHAAFFAITLYLHRVHIRIISVRTKLFMLSGRSQAEVTHTGSKQTFSE